MVVDLFLLLFLIMGVYKGWTNGFIMATVSFVSFFAGLALALQFSGWVEGYLKRQTDSNNDWLAFLAFLLVLIGAIIAIRILGKIIEKSVELVMLGLVNRLAGIFLYLFIYVSIFAVVLVYLKQFEIVGNETAIHSKSYTYLINFGGWVIDFFAEWLPAVKNLFNNTKEFIQQKT
jgi:membrane protein required for colicin V production